MPANFAAARKVLVIPARRNSTRLPDKMLLRETGKTLVEHTYEAACRSQKPDLVVIATDDEQIAREARKFGAPVVMTSPNCSSGTDRVAEAVRQMPRAEIIVNLQGDEPDADGTAVDKLFDLMEHNPAAQMATLATPLRDRAMLDDPACVKVVFDQAGRALYFSRSVIPHPREWSDRLLTGDEPAFHLHLGVYAYRRHLLMQITKWTPGRIEQIEKLEQLRVLENGASIFVELCDKPTRGIDTPADYAAFVARRLAG